MDLAEYYRKKKEPWKMKTRSFLRVWCAKMCQKWGVFEGERW